MIYAILIAASFGAAFVSGGGRLWRRFAASSCLDGLCRRRSSSSCANDCAAYRKSIPHGIWLQTNQLEISKVVLHDGLAARSYRGIRFFFASEGFSHAHDRRRVNHSCAFYNASQNRDQRRKKILLIGGAVVGLLTDKPTAMAALVAYPKMKLLDFTGTKDDFAVSEEEVNIGISVKKGNSELLNALNGALAKLTVEDFEKTMDEAISVQPLAK